MTPAQIELARHALGLPNDRRRSYRNRFVAGLGHTDYTDWMEMVDAGMAQRRDGIGLCFGGDDLFWLTVDGAEAALKPGEKLDPEDFPLRAERRKRKLRIGQRVRISAAGLNARIHQKSGIVQKIDQPDYPIVLWDGHKTPSCYYAAFIEPEQPDRHA